MAEDPEKEKFGELVHNSFSFREIVWKISKDKILLNLGSYDVQSPSFLFADATWAFHIYPNGRKNSGLQKFELVIERLNSEIPQQRVFYKSWFADFEGCKCKYFHSIYQFSAEHKDCCLFDAEKRNFSLIDFVCKRTNALVIMCEMRTPNLSGIGEFFHTAAVLQRSEGKPSGKWMRRRPRRGTSTKATSEQKPESPAIAGRDSNEGCQGLSKNPLPSDTMVRDFKELFLNQEDCDVVIHVKGRQFRAHKNILKARSPVFASTFRNDMKEKATGVVDIEDCDPSCFSDFLCYLYCGILENLSMGSVFSLFAAADKYDVQDLKRECLQFMKNSLSVDTFCDTIALALQHSEKELIATTTDFFVKNLQNIIPTVKWQIFLAENPTQSNELLIKALVSNNK